MQIANLLSLPAEANFSVSWISCYNSTMERTDFRATDDGGLRDAWEPQASLIRLEEEVRRSWRRRDLPAAVRAARSGQPSFTVCAQPLVVDQPRDDQVRLLAAVDLLARYQTMRGASVRERVGWAGHGLAVEVAVERSLATEEARIEEAAFNHACRERALAEVAQGERLASELGLWLHADDVYVTLTPEAVGTVWSALHGLWQAGRLRQERQVVPFCPRCATPLSLAEAACQTVQAQTQATWLLLPWEEEPGAYLVVWTPAPWMLAGMVALAAHPEASYVLVTPSSPSGGAPRRLLLAEAALRRLPAGEFQRVRRVPGKALRGSGYYPPFTFVPVGEQTAGIVLSEDVPLEQGSGLMPVTPSFEARSLALAVARDLPVPHLLDDWGRFDRTVSPWRGLSPLDVTPLVVENLRARGLLLRAEEASESRSLCPYCQTPLLPLARPVWLAETDSGPWILSRDRAWGTPLPIWICEGCSEATCPAGLDDLVHRAAWGAGQIEPHRPDVDRLTFPCHTCGGTMRRVPEVVDAEFEAAIIPWAAGPARELAGPGLAVSSGDRCTGWRDNMAELAALLGSSLVWEPAVPLGKGQRWPTVEPERRWAADTQRWAAYAGVTPEEAEEGFLRPLWSLVTAERDAVAGPGRPAAVGALLDRWLQARLYEVTCAVGQDLDAADPGRAARHLAPLPADLSRWYVAYHPAASLPLGPAGEEMVSILSRLLAPFVPHLAEAMSKRQAGLRPAAGTRPASGRGEVEGSVHLAAWPVPPPAWEDKPLLAQVALARRLAALGRTARAAGGLEAHTPLPHGVVGLETETAAQWPGPGALQDLLARALAVEQLEIVPDSAVELSWRLSLASGREPAREVPSAAIAEALGALATSEAAVLTAQLRAGLSIRLQAGGQAITLLPDEVQATPQAPGGWIAATESNLVISLKLGGS